MRICDWSSDVCSSDLRLRRPGLGLLAALVESPAPAGAAARRGPVQADEQLGRQRVAIGRGGRDVLVVQRSGDGLGHQPALVLRQIGRESSREIMWQYGCI